jgi:hypothetical protein
MLENLQCLHWDVHICIGVKMAEEQKQEGAAPELTVTDLQNIRAIIDIAATRGAFKASEMAGVGAVYSKLDRFLNVVIPTTAQQQAEQAPAQ